MSELKIVVTGASGRMGRTLIREIAQGNGMTLCGALEIEGHPNLGLDSGALAGMQPNVIKLTADPLPLLAHAQAVVDAFAANPDAGALNLNGKMIDMPHLKQAERILAMVGRAGR